MKHYEIGLSRRAERQLTDLYDYIASQSGEARAESFIGGIPKSCESLSIFPERGHQRSDIRPDLRIMGHARRATIAFSVDHKGRRVSIHGVFYGGQDVETALRDLD